MRTGGGVRLVEDTSPERAEYRADSVRVAIQHEDTELWAQRILPAEPAPSGRTRWATLTAIFDFVIGIDRWELRVATYAALMTDEYPPFRMDMAGADPGSVTVTPRPAWPADGAGCPAGERNRYPTALRRPRRACRSRAPPPRRPAPGQRAAWSRWSPAHSCCSRPRAF